MNPRLISTFLLLSAALTFPNSGFSQQSPVGTLVPPAFYTDGTGSPDPTSQGAIDGANLGFIRVSALGQDFTDWYEQGITFDWAWFDDIILANDDKEIFFTVYSKFIDPDGTKHIVGLGEYVTLNGTPLTEAEEIAAFQSWIEELATRANSVSGKHIEYWQLENEIFVDPLTSSGIWAPHVQHFPVVLTAFRDTLDIVNSNALLILPGFRAGQLPSSEPTSPWAKEVVPFLQAILSKAIAEGTPQDPRKLVNGFDVHHHEDWDDPLSVETRIHDTKIIIEDAIAPAFPGANVKAFLTEGSTWTCTAQFQVQQTQAQQAAFSFLCLHAALAGGANRVVAGTSMDRHETGGLGTPSCGRFSLNGLVANPAKDNGSPPEPCGCSEDYLTPTRKQAFAVWLASDLLKDATGITRNENSPTDIVRFDVQSAAISYSVLTTTNAGGAMDFVIPGWVNTVKVVSPDDPIQTGTFGTGAALDHFTQGTLPITLNQQGKQVVNLTLIDFRPTVILFFP